MRDLKEDLTEFECIYCACGPCYLKVRESQVNIERVQCPIQGDAEWEETDG